MFTRTKGHAKDLIDFSVCSCAPLSNHFHISEKSVEEMISAIVKWDYVHLHFGEYVRQIRIRRKMTLQEFGDALDLSHCHIWQIEHGGRRMSIPLLLKFQEILRNHDADVIEDSQC